MEHRRISVASIPMVRNFFISFLYILSIAVGAYGMRGVRLLSVGYLIYAIAMYIAIRYLVCTRCIYYGKPCILFGGTVAKILFKKREGRWYQWELRMVMLLWVILYVVPAIGLWIIDRLFFFLFIFSIILFNLCRIELGCRKCGIRPECPLGKHSFLYPW